MALNTSCEEGSSQKSTFGGSARHGIKKYTLETRSKRRTEKWVLQPETGFPPSLVFFYVVLAFLTNANEQDKKCKDGRKKNRHWVVDGIIACVKVLVESTTHYQGQ